MVKLLKILAISLVLLLLLSLLLIKPVVESSYFAEYLEDFLSEVLECEVEISAAPELELGSVTRVFLKKSSLCEDKESSFPSISFEKAVVDIVGKEILSGDFKISLVEVENPKIEFKESVPSDNIDNGDLQPVKLPSLPFTELKITKGHIVNLSGLDREVYELTTVDLRAKKKPGKNAFDLQLSADVEGVATELTGTVDFASESLLNLDLVLSNAVGSSISAKGGLSFAKSAVPQVDVELETKADSLLALGKLITLDLPDYGVVSAEGLVSYKDEKVSIKELVASLGESSTSGSFSWGEKKGKTEISADLDFKKLNLTDFAAKTKTAEKGEKDSSKEGVFSSDELPFATLSSLLSDVKLSFNELNLSDSFQLLNTEINVNSDGSVFDVMLSGAEIFSGTSKGKLSVSKFEAPEIKLNLSGKKISLGSALSASEVLSADSDLDLEIISSGKSLKEIVSTAGGKFSLTAGKGHFTNKILDLLSGSLYDLFKSVFGGKDEGNLHCIVSGFDIKDGKAVSSAQLFHTSVLTVEGEGELNLVKEDIDMVFNPRSHEPSLSSLLVPFSVSGKLNNIGVSVDMAGTVTDVISSPVNIAEGVVSHVESATSDVTGLQDSEEKSAELCADALKKVSTQG